MTPLDIPVREWIEALRGRGVEIALDGEQLAVRAPAGVLTAADRARLTAGRAALLEHLRTERKPPDDFALTDIQQAYWVGRRSIALGNVGCHAYREFSVDTMDMARLERAWQQLVTRHGMLRAVISGDGRQRILDDVPPYRIEVLDLRGAADSTERLEKLRAELSHRTFDPAVWPMFDIRATLCDDGLRLHVGMDLLIADATSMLQLYREWEALYRDPAAALPALPRTFRDYVRTHRVEPSELARSTAYWNERLPSLPGAPELPLAMAPEQVTHPHFTRHTRTLEPTVWTSLCTRARAAGITPSNLLAAAYADILAKWSRHPHFLITLTTFGAPAEYAGVVGDFTSTVLLEVDARAPTFMERARALQSRLAQDLDHSGWSGVRVMRELAKRNQRLTDSIPVVFTSALGHRTSADGALPLAWLGRSVHAITQTPQVWIDHHVIEDGERLHVTWDVADALFPPGLVEDMFAAHGAFLHALASGEDAWNAPLGRHVPATQMEKRRRANATDAPLPPGFLHDGFMDWARREPQRVAVVTREGGISYGQLASHAVAIARTLREAGVQRNTLVGVSLPKGWQQIAAVLGIVLSGAAYLPIETTLPPARRHALARHGGLSIVIADTHDWPENIRAIAFDSVAAGGEAPAPLAGADPADLAYVIFTSGSTGEPKCVMIEHRAALNTLVDVNRRFGITGDDAVLGLSALGFDLSVFDIFGLLGCGGRLVLPDPERLRDPGHWLALMQREHVSVWNTVPALLTMLVDHGGAVDSALRVVMLSGDWIPLGLPARIKAAAPGCTVWSLGGATEASIWSNGFEVRRIEPHWRSIPYGWPLANQRFHVLDDTGEPAPEGVAGRLHIAGHGLARGYWNDPARTAERFVTLRSGERAYDTGDIGRYLPDGAIEFLGREDSQVKVRGHRIELGEVEARLRAHDQVQEALVLAPGGAQDRRLVAWIVPRAADATLLERPEQRLTWKLERHAIRPVREDASRVALAPVEPREADWRRRTTRRFTSATVSSQALAELLSALGNRAGPDGITHRYRYASAGSAYCVQAWVHVKAGRVDGIDEGFYYYHPDRHDLERVAQGALHADALHVAANRGAFETAAFSIFFVAALDAMRPLYGEHARDFCLIEAGYMGQVLMEAAAGHGMGLCPIGLLDVEALAPLALDASREVVHSFVAGWPAEAASSEVDAPVRAGEPLHESLRAWCADALPDYMIPAAFVTLAALPLTPNGKIDRARLPQPEAERVADALPPDGPLEEMVASIFAEVLGEKNVARDDVIFDLGGTSVHVVRIHRRLEERLAAAVDIVDVFRFPSVRQLAVHLAQTAAPPSASEGAARGMARRQLARTRRGEA